MKNQNKTNFSYFTVEVVLNDGEKFTFDNALSIKPDQGLLVITDGTKTSVFPLMNVKSYSFTGYGKGE